MLSIGVAIAGSISGSAVIYWRSYAGLLNKVGNLETKMDMMCTEVRKINNFNSKFLDLSQRMSAIEAILGVRDKLDS
jgi:hypothetical protein